jgi:hypothetical protein
MTELLIGRFFMLSVLQDLLELAKKFDKNAPIISVAEAAIKTATNPSPENILEDIELALKLVHGFKRDVNNLHPKVQEIVKELL